MLADIPNGSQKIATVAFISLEQLTLKKQLFLSSVAVKPAMNILLSTSRDFNEMLVIWHASISQTCFSRDCKSVIAKRFLKNDVV